MVKSAHLKIKREGRQFGKSMQTNIQIESYRDNKHKH